MPGPGKTATRRRELAPGDLAHVAVFAALIAALALLPAVSLGPISITLQTLGVALTALCLGPWRGFAAVALYLGVGVAGLPVFAKGGAGLAVLVGPTGGYLLSFPLAALVSGFVARWALRQGLNRITPVVFLGSLVATRLLIIAPIAVTHMSRVLGLTWTQALLVDLPFWGLDLAKYVVAALLAVAVHKAFPRLLRR